MKKSNIKAKAKASDAFVFKRKNGSDWGIYVMYV